MTRKILFATGIVVAVTIASGVLIAFVFHNRVQSEAIEEMSRQARVTASLIEEDLADVRFSPQENPGPQLIRNRAQLNRNLERAKALGGHDRVEAVFTIRGRVIPITDPLEMMRQIPISTQEGVVENVDVNGEQTLVAVERLELREGTLVVAIGRTSTLFPTRQLVLALLLALALGSVLTLGLGVWFSRSLSIRLANVGDTARRVGSGDLTARADVAGRDEISLVANAVNDMAADLETARKREREFLLDVGHDLRSPLTTVRGYAEALDRGDVPPEQMPDVAKAMHRQTDHLSRLVEDVMLLARLETREFTLRPDVVDMGPIVAGIAESYRMRAESASLSLDITDEAGAFAFVDADRVAQIVGNLMDNALRYTPEGGSIGVAVGSTPSQAVLTVRNSGPKISQEDLPHVFERLYAADRYRAVRPSGSGLGLAIVRELVLAMGGSVSATSDESTGTTFAVSFDVKAPTPQ